MNNAKILIRLLYKLFIGNLIEMCKWMWNEVKKETSQEEKCDCHRWIYPDCSSPMYPVGTFIGQDGKIKK